MFLFSLDLPQNPESPKPFLCILSLDIRLFFFFCTKPLFVQSSAYFRYWTGDSLGWLKIYFHLKKKRAWPQINADLQDNDWGRTYRSSWDEGVKTRAIHEEWAGKTSNRLALKGSRLQQLCSFCSLSFSVLNKITAFQRWGMNFNKVKIEQEIFLPFITYFPTAGWKPGLISGSVCR